MVIAMTSNGFHTLLPVENTAMTSSWCHPRAGMAISTLYGGIGVL